MTPLKIDPYINKLGIQRMSHSLENFQKPKELNTSLKADYYNR
jgi:hypothetical protein